MPLKVPCSGAANTQRTPKLKLCYNCAYGVSFAPFFLLGVDILCSFFDLAQRANNRCCNVFFSLLQSGLSRSEPEKTKLQKQTHEQVYSQNVDPCFVSPMSVSICTFSWPHYRRRPHVIHQWMNSLSPMRLINERKSCGWDGSKRSAGFDDHSYRYFKIAILL